MLHLNNALHYLNVNLPVDWVDRFSPAITDDDTSVGLNVLNANVAIIGVLDPEAGIFFDELHLSVITGEYVEDLVGATVTLDNIENYLTNLAANIDIPSFPNMTMVSQDIFTEAFLLPIRRCIKHYRKLIDFVMRHLNYQPDISMIFHELKSERVDVDALTSAAKTESELFGINLKLAEIDHSLSFKRETFRDLLLNQHELINLGTTTVVSDLLLKKCAFLLYKLSFRLQQSKKRYDYAIEFNYASVNLVPVSELSQFNDLIKGHYDEGINPSSFDHRIKAALTEFRKNAPVLDLDQYHALIKYFKDEAKSISKLERLKDLYQVFYDNKISSGLSDFDKKAYEIVFCYLENNLLSLELERKKFNLDNWEIKFKVYTDRANQSLNSNFFPYFKIIKKFLLPEINTQFSLDNQDFDIIDKLIKQYESSLKNLIENTAICEETDYLPYQADFDHSFVILNNVYGNPQKCFLSSSFVIPFDYVNFKDKLEFYKVELTKFKTMLDNQKLSRKDREDIQKVKTDIERSDKRHIEILSIFAALVMFVSGEIQIFTKITNMADAVAFTLFFAYGLGLFVLLIWLITRPEGLKFTSFSLVHVLIFIFFGVGLVTGVKYVNKEGPEKSKTQQILERQNFQIDSLKRQGTIDSLKLPRKFRAENTTKK